MLWKKRMSPDLKYCDCIFLERLRKITKNCSQNSWYRVRYLNRAPLEYMYVSSVI
jgi:hypothetical protein